MTDVREGDLPSFGPVTYTLKVVHTGEGDAARRTVVFQRRTAGDAIEISAETEAPNLLALFPDLLDAAFSAQRALADVPSPFPSFPEESRLLRRLTGGGSPSALRVTGAALLSRERRART
jgi:hypothetical protein